METLPVVSPSVWTRIVTTVDATNDVATIVVNGELFVNETGLGLDASETINSIILDTGNSAGTDYDWVFVCESLGVSLWGESL